MVETPFLSRQARFESVGSTNDVVRSWLAEGVPEVCLAVADEQTLGRGRAGRQWHAPAGAALLLSLGFRPTWLSADRVWRLPATASLAMADAAEEVAGLPDGAIRLKWPNDLVVSFDAPAGDLDDTTSPGATGRAIRKLAGVLAESEGLGTSDPRVVVGIGLNAEWRAEAFPPELAATMTSLYEASGRRPIDRPLLLDAFLGRLEVRVAALGAGRFDLADWNSRQLTTGRVVDIVGPDGERQSVRAVGVDAASGALLVEDEQGEHPVHVGEVAHVRVPAGAGV